MKNPKEIKIQLTPEVAEGTYANLAVITHSAAEFVIDFVRIMPGMPQSPVKSRIILTPENAKRLMFALDENVAKFEDLHGNIQLGKEAPTAFLGTEGNA